MYVFGHWPRMCLIRDGLRLRGSRGPEDLANDDDEYDYGYRRLLVEEEGVNGDSVDPSAPSGRADNRQFRDDEEAASSSSRASSRSNGSVLKRRSPGRGKGEKS